MGFCLKNPSSKTASGNGRFNACRFAYNPVSGDLKSGIPADVEMPAPVSTIMFLALRVQSALYGCIFHQVLTLPRFDQLSSGPKGVVAGPGSLLPA